MEVHHHSHPPASAGHRKKWTHYFWEFLMLFLAVFCGFLAEYQLEHKIEKDKEIQFIKSLVSDLEEDGKIVRQNILTNQMRLAQMDSFLHIINDPALLSQKGDEVYYFARVGPRLQTLINNTKTFDQLKNSGGFRLIQSNETANRIMDYYNQLPMIRQLEELYFDEFANYKTFAARLFDPLIFRKMENEDGSVNRNAGNPSLRSKDPELMKEFGIYIVYMNGTTRSIVPLESRLLESAKELIQYLKEKYHLK